MSSRQNMYTLLIVLTSSRVPETTVSAGLGACQRRLRHASPQWRIHVAVTLTIQLYPFCWIRTSAVHYVGLSPRNVRTQRLEDHPIPQASVSGLRPQGIPNYTRLAWRARYSSHNVHQRFRRVRARTLFVSSSVQAPSKCPIRVFSGFRRRHARQSST